MTEVQVTTIALEVLVEGEAQARITDMTLDVLHNVKEAPLPPPPPSGTRGRSS